MKHPSNDITHQGSVRAQQAARRARRRGFWLNLYAQINSLFQLRLIDLRAFLQTALKWSLLGAVVGALAGAASAIFLISLDWATQMRLTYEWLIFGLPLAGLTVGWLYTRFGGSAVQGNNLVIDEVNRNQSRIPLRMAPMVLLGTVVTHLFGGSAGREGTAIQMGASLADGAQRLLRLNADDRRLMIMAGISGGFGSVFGVPVAGLLFGMEVQSVGRIRYEGLIPCLAAAYVGDLVTRSLGAPHSHYPHLPLFEIEPLLLLKVAVAGVCFGFTSILFVELTHGIRYAVRRAVGWPPLHPVIGGVAVLALTWLVGARDYLGLSLPLIHDSLEGGSVLAYAFLLKLLFTAVTLGTGYLGGEVTPLFVIGATLGHALGGPLGVDPALMASIGLVAVFAGASNTPIACAMMGIELFGGGAALYLFLGCIVAYLASGHRGIYVTQLVHVPKSIGVDVQADESLRTLAERRQSGWLPPLPALNGDLGQRPVRAVMSAPPVAIHPETPLAELAALAVREGVRALPVVDAQQRLVGMVTDNDLRRAGMATNLTQLQQMTPTERAAALRGQESEPAAAMMTAPAVSVLHTATLADAVRLLRGQALKRLPVTDQAGHLIGVITRSDILREVAYAPPGAAAQAGALLDTAARIEAITLEPTTTLAPDASVKDAVQAMRNSGQKRLVVADGARRPLGMLTERDLLTRLPAVHRAWVRALLRDEALPDEPAALPLAGELMTTPVVTAQLADLAFAAVRVLIDNQLKRLVVVDEQGRCVGLVGRAGLLAALLIQPAAEDELSQPNPSDQQPLTNNH